MPVVTLHRAVAVDELPHVVAAGKEMPRAKSIGMAAMEERPASATQRGITLNQRHVEPTIRHHMSRKTARKAAADNKNLGQLSLHPLQWKLDSFFASRRCSFLLKFRAEEKKIY